MNECRRYLDATFDVDRVLTSIAIQNFGQAWDDNVHNWFIYQRNTDGKWSTFPWDQDRMYGEHQGWVSNKSIYIGDTTT
jgi:spore coat protein CotH